MITTADIEIDAPASTVWDAYADVERWPEWTASVRRVVPLGGPGIDVGKRFEIDQPRMPRLVWEVTEVEPGASWTWVQRSPGGTTIATHEVVPLSAERTLARLGVDQRGPIGLAVGVLARRMTRRYLDLEARGLKATSERRRRDAPTA